MEHLWTNTFVIVQWTLLNRITDKRVSRLVESNVLVGMESFLIPAVKVYCLRESAP